MTNCELCKEATPPDELEDLAGFSACERCRTGDPRPAIKAHGFEHKAREGEVNHGDDRHRFLYVSVRRTRELDAVGVLRFAAYQEIPPMPFFKRLFFKADPDREDLKVTLEAEIRDADTMHEFTLNELVAHSGVRQALIMLAPCREDVDVGFLEEVIRVKRPLSKGLPWWQDVLRPLFLLSLYREKLGL